METATGSGLHAITLPGIPGPAGYCIGIKLQFVRVIVTTEL
jgi:hypothetical protein